ncbi:peptidylprolyl isomerase [Fretibacter rubidus]|uniref:peptidylprolyl isomerase n=1 Tax=Fretibacter rubidus TaxID=570162 RepID=UPI00352A2258
MMSRFLLSTCAALAFSVSACAAEAPQDSATVAPTASVTTTADVSAPDSAWRTVDPENLMLIDTEYGMIGVELFPEIAPKHVEQIKTLTRQNFYDFITFHRVIEGFMNQTGDPKGDGTGDSDLPDIEGEFTFRRSPSMPIELIGAQPVDPRSPSKGEVGVGFYKGLPVASQPASQAILTKDGKVDAFAIHCKGVTSMARSQNPNSGNSQFFLMRDTASHLDTQYSIWGNTVMGRNLLTKIKVGNAGEGGFVPDAMKTVRIAADLPEGERPTVQVMKVDSAAFDQFMATQKKADGKYPEICDIAVPTRTL